LEGNYGLNKYISLANPRGRIKCIFSIKQRAIDKPTGDSYVPFILKIADLFQCKIKYESENIIIFLAQVNSKHRLTKSYFDKYPLMISKHLGYLWVLQALDCLGKHLIDREIINIRAIKFYE